MEKLIEKENSIFEILQKFLDSKLKFIVIGGYAVSSYKHRFSVDADVVIQPQDTEKFEKILIKEKFKKTSERELENVYSSKFMRYEKETASIDLLINGVVARTTNGSFSHKLLSDNSQKRKIIGIQKEINALVPNKEVLIAMKIHSGRLTDFRDIAALATRTNLEKIRKILFVGDLKSLKKNMKNLEKAVKDKNFVDSFKGVFIEKKFDVDIRQVEKIAKLEQ